jgi:hypothetical protein
VKKSKKDPRNVGIEIRGIFIGASPKAVKKRIYGLTVSMFTWAPAGKYHVMAFK